MSTKPITQTDLDAVFADTDTQRLASAVMHRLFRLCHGVEIDDPMVRAMGGAPTDDAKLRQASALLVERLVTIQAMRRWVGDVDADRQRKTSQMAEAILRLMNEWQD